MKNLVAVTVLERLARAQFAGAEVVVPRIVHERDPPVDCAAHQLDRFLLSGNFPEVKSAHANEGNHHARVAEGTIDHVALALFARHGADKQRQVVGGGNQRVDRFGLGGGVGFGAAGAQEALGGGESGSGDSGGFQEGTAG